MPGSSSHQTGYSTIPTQVDENELERSSSNVPIIKTGHFQKVANGFILNLDSSNYVPNIELTHVAKNLDEVRKIMKEVMKINDNDSGPNE